MRAHPPERPHQIATLSIFLPGALCPSIPTKDLDNRKATTPSQSIVCRVVTPLPVLFHRWTTVGAALCRLPFLVLCSLFFVFHLPLNSASKPKFHYNLTYETQNDFLR